LRAATSRKTLSAPDVTVTKAARSLILPGQAIGRERAMAPLVRIRGWRARRRDRKDAELIGLAALSPTEGADATRVQERVRTTGGKARWWSWATGTQAGTPERKGDRRNTDPLASRNC